MSQPSDRPKRSSSRPPASRPPARPAKGYRAERSPRSVYQSQPRTIDYRCKRCCVTQASQPLPTAPNALAIYGLPSGWELASNLSTEAMQHEPEDFCLCAACSEDVRRGFPVDLRDLGRRT